MALRSSLSSLRASTPVPQDPTDAEEDTSPKQDVVQGPTAPSVPARGRVTTPAVDESPVTKAAAGRGRPRLTPEEKAARAAARAASRQKKAAATDIVGMSVREIRALIKDVENDMSAVKASVEAAIAKFQPKVDELRTKHAELNAKLTETLLK